MHVLKYMYTYKHSNTAINMNLHLTHKTHKHTHSGSTNLAGCVEADTRMGKTNNLQEKNLYSETTEREQIKRKHSHITHKWSKSGG